jgi:hypothetical protein
MGTVGMPELYGSKWAAGQPRPRPANATERHPAGQCAGLCGPRPVTVPLPVAHTLTPVPDSDLLKWAGTGPRFAEVGGGPVPVPVPGPGRFAGIGPGVAPPRRGPSPIPRLNYDLSNSG